jgi:hypothetical protein
MRDPELARVILIALCGGGMAFLIVALIQFLRDEADSKVRH